MLIFYLLCYAAVLNFFTYYAQYYAHVKELCSKKLYGECSIRVYQVHIKYGECSIRVITSMVSVLLEYIDLY